MAKVVQVNANNVNSIKRLWLKKITFFSLGSGLGLGIGVNKLSANNSIVNSIAPPLKKPEPVTLIKSRLFGDEERQRFVLEKPTNWNFSAFVPSTKHLQLIVTMTLQDSSILLPILEKQISPWKKLGLQEWKHHYHDGAWHLDFIWQHECFIKFFALNPIENVYGHRLVVDFTNLAIEKKQMIENIEDSKNSEASIDEIHKIISATASKNLEKKEFKTIKTIKKTTENVKNTTNTDTKLKSKLKPTKKIIIKHRIIIDAGHGGDDPGAVAQLGNKEVYEKDIVLKIAKKLQLHINKNTGKTGVKAFLTRKSDVFIPLEERQEIASKYCGDLFISLHADASDSKTADGASVYILGEKNATSLAAKLLAQGQNNSDKIGGSSPSRKLIAKQSSQLQKQQLQLNNKSKKFARYLLKNTTIHLHKENVEEANFFVLKSEKVPAVLFEMGFISNNDEMAKLLNPTHQTKIINMIDKSVNQYFGLTF